MMAALHRVRSRADFAHADEQGFCGFFKSSRVLDFGSPRDCAPADAEETRFQVPSPRGIKSGSRPRAMRKLDWGSAPVERLVDVPRPKTGVQIGCSSTRVSGKSKMLLDSLDSLDDVPFFGRTMR
eukprot:jgi/Tetstr1/448101/TSEL_035400.t1